MSIQDKIQRVQRVEEFLAVQFVKGDAEIEAIIRGWSGYPEDMEIDIPDGCWLVKRRDDEALFVVPTEDYAEVFVKVVEVETTDEEVKQ